MRPATQTVGANAVRADAAGSLTAARAAHEQADAAFLAAQENVRVNAARFSETEADLERAREELRDASLALASGGSDDPFNMASQRVAVLEARLRALNEMVLPPARAALAEAAAHETDCRKAVAEEAFTGRLREQVLPAFRQIASLVEDLAEALRNYDDLRASIVAQLYADGLEVKPSDPTSLAWTHPAVPVRVRNYVAEILPARPFDPAALEAYAARFLEDR